MNTSTAGHQADPYRWRRLSAGAPQLLWAFEGITSYYDELAVLRSGVLDADGYLDLLATTVTRVMRGIGRQRQSVAESSFDVTVLQTGRECAECDRQLLHQGRAGGIRTRRLAAPARRRGMPG